MVTGKLTLTRVFHPGVGEDGGKAAVGVGTRAFVGVTRVFVGFGVTLRLDIFPAGVQLTKIMTMIATTQLRIIPAHF